MKFVNRILSLVIAAVACTVLLTSVGCKKTITYGGIVESYELKEEYYEPKEGDILLGLVDPGYYPQLTVTFDEKIVPDTQYCYCVELTIYKTDFEKFEVNSLKKLLRSADFLNIIKDEYQLRMVKIFGTSLGPVTYFFSTDKFAYLLYYYFTDTYTETPTVEDLTDYSGYLKFN